MPDISLTIISNAVSETKALGASLGELVTNGDIICLQGDLGSGKTSLTQGIGQGMQIRETINSPTFVFVHEHHPANGGACLYHVDLYRIENPLDIIALGLTDYMYGDGVVVIEWAERARELMPRDCLWISLDLLGDTQRRLTLSARGQRPTALLSALQVCIARAGLEITQEEC